mmetsp:Transcript_12316/g.17726  ORF Transcript_12316/g.17726 Transcript_12316/m.17726 type:complete len:230 (+) Transcript_12316:125-814(+)
MASMMAHPPLLPRMDAILILDGDGNRLAGKYYGDFFSMKQQQTADKGGSIPLETRTSSIESLRAAFERQVHAKIHGISAKADAAEVVTVAGKTAVFCGGKSDGQTPGDVRVVIVGPPGESELVLAHFVEGMFEALSSLMGGATDRAMVLDNLELVLLLMDEMCDGGLVLETSGPKLCNSVLLRDESEMPPPQGVPVGRPGMPTGEMTIAQALKAAREQLMANMSQRDGS